MQVRPVFEAIARRPIGSWIALGIVFRLSQYLSGRALWLDESSLWGNIVPRPWSKLFGSLESTQLAPPIFLGIEWVMVRAFGPSPYVLRFLPLAGGIASLFLLARMARICLRPRGAVIAVALFAVADELIYYSSELKQYSTDVATALGCILMGLAMAGRPLTAGRAVGMAAFGGVVMWFSHPSAFVLAGVGLTLFESAIHEKRWGRALGLVPVGMAWAGSLAGLYFESMRQLNYANGMWQFWDFAFPGVAVDSFWNATWPFRRMIYLFVTPLDFAPTGPWPFRQVVALFVDPPEGPMSAYPTPIVTGLCMVAPMILFAVGCVSLRKRHGVSFRIFEYTLLFAVIGAYMKVFPLHGRLALYLMPSLVALIAEGADGAIEKAGRRWFRVAVLGSLLFFPILKDVEHLMWPRDRIGINPFGDRRNNGLDPYWFPLAHPKTTDDP